MQQIPLVHTNKPHIKPRLHGEVRLVPENKKKDSENFKQDNPIEPKDETRLVQRYASGYKKNYDSSKDIQVKIENSEDGQKEKTEEKQIQSVKEEKKKINKLIKQTDRVLFKAYTVFPFTPFPHELVIDENKINYVESTFFFTKNTRNILLANVAEAKVGTSPFFSSLTIMDMSFDRRQEIRIPYLRSNDAISARNIIQGLIIAKKEGIDVSKLTHKELVEKIEDLGNVKGEQYV